MPITAVSKKKKKKKKKKTPALPNLPFVQSSSRETLGVSRHVLETLGNTGLVMNMKAFLAESLVNRSCRILWRMCTELAEIVRRSQSMPEARESSTSGHRITQSFNAVGTTARLAELVQRGQSTLGAEKSSTGGYRAPHLANTRSILSTLESL